MSLVSKLSDIRTAHLLCEDYRQVSLPLQYPADLHSLVSSLVSAWVIGAPHSELGGCRKNITMVDLHVSQWLRNGFSLGMLSSAEIIQILRLVNGRSRIVNEDVADWFSIVNEDINSCAL